MSHPHPSRWCKICGITNVADARAVADAGGDAYGLMFYAQSPRVVSVETAGAIARCVDSVSRVGVFVNHTEAEVLRVLGAVDLDLLQFHGDESPEFCAGFGVPFIKALRMRGSVDIGALAASYTGAWGILLDTYVPGVIGGTGTVFDWSMWPQSGGSWILAGGLTADNVAQAVRQTHPFGVDVSGGVEASEGVKSRELIRRFIQEARSV